MTNEIMSLFTFCKAAVA